VTDVETGGAGAPRPFTIHRTADGALRGAATFGAAGAVRCELFDVTGRLVSRLRFDVTQGSREWTLPDISPLRAGLYFARLLGGGQNATAKVAVAP
jgi:hypothetical protein